MAHAGGRLDALLQGGAGADRRARPRPHLGPVGALCRRGRGREIRVVQEALTNVARHAQASHATVELAVADGGAQARIIDDGVGFALGDSPPRSLGLAGMTERASLIDGLLEIVSVPGQGTTVLLEVPRWPT